ncbi:MAG: polysaccharide biosynthesis C-terminal domain-containing protein, partial [Flavobacteriales bacterium]|nr:polysaccharide biosynthesis C-terminal domain-containing protein [Flavobacteriales bacterium]
LDIDAVAAPFTPYFGINIKFRATFKIAPKRRIFAYIFWFPVICKIFPTEPEKELINLPQDKKINAVTPILNLILIPKYGVNGAATASMSSLIVWNLSMVLVVKKKFGFYTFYNPFRK